MRVYLVALRVVLYAIFGFILPSVCIYFADKYYGECPIQPYIIIYLYVSGVFCMVRGLLGFIEQMALLSGLFDEDLCNNWCVIPDVIIGTFLFCWFIAGSVWVYKARGQYSTDLFSPDYCHQDLIIVSHVTLALQWILLPVTLRKMYKPSSESSTSPPENV